MPQVSARLEPACKSVDRNSLRHHRKPFRSNDLVMLRAHSLWPVKMPLHVAEITGYSPRTVENWDAQRTRIPADALASLLRSEWGRHFLADVMTDATPKWWKQLWAWVRAIDYASAEAKLRRKRKELLDAEFVQSPSFAQTFQDEEFYGAQPAPPRRVHRAVVSTVKR